MSEVVVKPVLERGLFNGEDSSLADALVTVGDTEETADDVGITDDAFRD